MHYSFWLLHLHCVTQYKLNYISFTTEYRLHNHVTWKSRLGNDRRIKSTDIARNMSRRGHYWGPKFETADKGFLVRGRAPSPTATESGECCKLPQQGFQMYFGRIRSLENLSAGHKCRLVPVFRFNSVFGVLSPSLPLCIRKQTDIIGKLSSM